MCNVDFNTAGTGYDASTNPDGGHNMPFVMYQAPAELNKAEYPNKKFWGNFYLENVGASDGYCFESTLSTQYKPYANEIVWHSRDNYPMDPLKPRAACFR